jgi:hypothetical protein
MNNDENPIKNLNEFIQKVDEMKKQDKMDLSSDQDLTIAIMNLVSIEEHFFFSGAKTGKTEYYDMIKDVREMRKELLKKIIKEYEGEVWCISKHLLAASYRLMEVGTKQLGIGKKEEAYDLFDKAYNLYSLFWGLNLKLINVGDIKKISDNALNKNDDKNINNRNNDAKKINSEDNSEINKEKNGIMGKLGTLVKKAIDCCIE